MNLTGVHHVALTVRSSAASAEWYKATFGFTELVHYRNESIRARCHVLVHPDLDGLMLSFNEYDDHEGDRFDERRTGLDHLAFGVDGEGALAQWGRHLDERGIAYSTTTLPELSILVCRDPDNIQIELCTPRQETDVRSLDGEGRLARPA